MDFLNNVLADGTIKMEHNIKDDDLIKMIVGVVVALSCAIAVGVILAKKVS